MRLIRLPIGASNKAAPSDSIELLVSDSVSLERFTNFAKGINIYFAASDPK